MNLTPEQEKDELWFWIPACAFCAVVGFVIGYVCADSSWKSELIERDMCHWEASDTGRTYFVYAPSSKDKEQLLSDRENYKRLLKDINKDLETLNE